MKIIVARLGFLEDSLPAVGINGYTIVVRGDDMVDQDWDAGLARRDEEYEEDRVRDEEWACEVAGGGE